jgi:hypothetical protein
MSTAIDRCATAIDSGAQRQLTGVIGVIFSCVNDTSGDTDAASFGWVVTPLKGVTPNDTACPDTPGWRSR